MYTVEECKKDLITALEKIASRNQNIAKKDYSAIDLEIIDVRFGSEFVIFIGADKYTINAFTDISTARHVYENIDKIDYFYFEDYDFDSLVGDISGFVVTELKYDLFSSEYMSAMYYYSKYICESDHAPSRDDILTYIERKVDDEIKNKRIG